MPLYEYYCQPCHGVFEELRPMREASEAESDAIEAARALAREFAERATGGLGALPAGEARRTLDELGGYVLTRRA